jgi:putative peptidoglycan lipid II flippase
MAYGVGMPAYLGRDVLVRVFYALGDGNTPFRISIAGIGINAGLDWLLVGSPLPGGMLLPQLNFQAPGLVLATVGVNVFSCVALLFALRKKLGSLPLGPWTKDSFLLTLAALVGGALAWALATAVAWPPHLIGKLLQVLICGGIGAVSYGLIAGGFGVPEARELGRLFTQRFAGRER